MHQRVLASWLAKLKVFGVTMFEVKKVVLSETSNRFVVCRCVLSNYSYSFIHKICLLQARPYMLLAIVNASDIIRLFYYCYR